MIEELFSKLKTILPEPPNPPMWLGARYASQRDAPVERIVLIPDTEAYEPASPVHFAFGAPEGAVCAGLATRVTTFEAHLWGKTFGSTETLLMRFLQAMRRCLPRPSLVEWRATWARPDYETLGEELILTWGVRTQVWVPPDMIPWETVELDGVDTQCGCEHTMTPFPVRPATTAERS